MDVTFTVLQHSLRGEPSFDPIITLLDDLYPEELDERR